jgi:NhaP-type Na+/H+ or K+/H+ antiporter
MSAGGGSVLLPLVAAVIAIGVIAQVLADRFQVPSVLFLIATGLLLGPISRLVASTASEGHLDPYVGAAVADDLATLLAGGILGSNSFGGALSAIVGLSVAIIVFEGAFHLKLDRIREAPTEAIKLVTLGAAVALVGTAVAVRVLLGETWAVSFLIGSLLVATGPTVITPILEVVPVRDRVAAALETEGIVNDVTAAILAVVIFEAIVSDVGTVQELLQLFAERLGTGVIVGVLVTGLLYYGLRYVDLSPGNAPQNARLLTLAGAVVAYGAADAIYSEAGVAAVATAGFLLGNADVPYEEEIEAFKGDITLLVLSFVFIALAALLEFQFLLQLGLEGLVIVAVVALVLRPLLVFASSTGDRFTRGEKLFVSFVGPRGIIPASVATLFAIQLRAQGMVAAGDTLVGTVFLVILVTVVFEAGFARRIAEFLNVIPMRIIIIGGGRVGRALATRLADRGENVVIVENDPQMVEQARNQGFTVHMGDGTDTDVLRSAGAENASRVIAATGDDDVNLLVSQLSSSTFDTEEVIARANNPDNVEAFEELGVRTISASDATAWAIDNAIERPALAQWMTQLGEEGDVQEVEVTTDDLVGRTVREVGEELPDGCLIALATRDGETRMPGPDFTVQMGDHLTFLGRTEDVREAMSICGRA